MKMLDIDIEREFASIVRDNGGVVLPDILPRPNFLNADFVFHMQRIVAELKCVTKDNVFSGNNIDKVNRLLCGAPWKLDIPWKDIDEATWKQLPRELQVEITKIFGNSIKRRIAKANRQIRETKDNLRLHDYIGLLIIANDGVTSFPPAAFINAIQLTLKNNFHEIRHFIYMTVNMAATMRNVPIPVVFWVSFNMEDGPAIDEPFLMHLGVEWRRHCSVLSGIPTIDTELNDIEGFWQSRHI